ncbi:uncharacterized protein LOC141908742 [Tubulanus polymorphus]|uniref:uncharacterized protein LOC141908742 n=1 Tax=Tubulanus polymorphus TaxID=672921 RepID=UPI003DA2E935
MLYLGMPYGLYTIPPPTRGQLADIVTNRPATRRRNAMSNIFENLATSQTEFLARHNENRLEPEHEDDDRNELLLSTERSRLRNRRNGLSEIVLPDDFDAVRCQRYGKRRNAITDDDLDS